MSKQVEDFLSWWADKEKRGVSSLSRLEVMAVKAFVSWQEQRCLLPPLVLDGLDMLFMVEEGNDHVCYASPEEKAARKALGDWYAAERRKEG